MQHSCSCPSLRKRQQILGCSDQMQQSHPVMLRQAQPCQIQGQRALLCQGLEQQRRLVRPCGSRTRQSRVQQRAASQDRVPQRRPLLLCWACPSHSKEQEAVKTYRSGQQRCLTRRCRGMTPQRRVQQAQQPVHCQGFMLRRILQEHLQSPPNQRKGQ